MCILNTTFTCLSSLDTYTYKQTYIHALNSLVFPPTQNAKAVSVFICIYVSIYIYIYIYYMYVYVYVYKYILYVSFMYSSK